MWAKTANEDTCWNSGRFINNVDCVMFLLGRTIFPSLSSVLWQPLLIRKFAIVWFTSALATCYCPVCMGVFSPVFAVSVWHMQVWQRRWNRERLRLDWSHPEGQQGTDGGKTRTGGHVRDRGQWRKFVQWAVVTCYLHPWITRDRELLLLYNMRMSILFPYFSYLGELKMRYGLHCASRRFRFVHT